MDAELTTSEGVVAIEMRCRQCGKTWSDLPGVMFHLSGTNTYQVVLCAPCEQNIHRITYTTGSIC